MRTRPLRASTKRVCADCHDAAPATIRTRMRMPGDTCRKVRYYHRACHLKFQARWADRLRAQREYHYSVI